MSSDWFGYILVISFYVAKVFSESSPGRLPVSPMYNFLQPVQVTQKMTLAKVHPKRSVFLMNLLGLKIFSSLRMKGQDLHRERAYLKVPGWSLV